MNFRPLPQTLNRISAITFLLFSMGLLVFVTYKATYPKISFGCITQLGEATERPAFGDNHCGFSIRKPWYLFDANRVEYKIKSYYPEAVGTLLSPRYEYGEPQVFASTIHMQAGHASQRFPWRSGSRDLLEGVGRVVEQAVTTAVDNAPSLLASYLGIPAPISPDLDSVVTMGVEASNVLSDAFAVNGPEVIRVRASICGTVICTQTREIEVRAMYR